MLIAQLSDLHLKANGGRAYGRVDTLSTCRAAIEHINRLSPDCVVVTGDLADSGADGDYVTVVRELSRLNAPYYCVPGNHDRRQAFQDALSPFTAFNHDDFCVFLKEFDDIILVGLDSLEEGMQQGYLGDRQCKWLADKLQRATDKPHLIFLHHPPMDTGIAHMDAKKLQNAEQLAMAIEGKSNVAGIACGHLHRAVSSQWQGVPVWSAPAHNHSVTLDFAPQAQSTFSFEAPAVRLFHITGGNVVSHISPVGIPDGPYAFSAGTKNPA